MKQDDELPEMSHAHTDDGRLIDNDEIQGRVFVVNNLRAEQRVALNQLEAEL